MSRTQTMGELSLRTSSLPVMSIAVIKDVSASPWIDVNIVNQGLYLGCGSHGVFCGEDELKETHDSLSPLQSRCSPRPQSQAMCTECLSSHVTPSRCEIYTIQRDGENFTFLPEHTCLCFKGHSPEDAGN